MNAGLVTQNPVSGKQLPCASVSRLRWGDGCHEADDQNATEKANRFMTMPPVCDLDGRD